MGLIGLGFFHSCNPIPLGERDVRAEKMVRKALGVMVVGAVVIMGWRTVWMAKEIVPYDVTNRSFKAGVCSLF